jgi:hypothetical protein
MLSTTVIITLTSLVAVATVVGLLSFVLRDSGQKASARLDTLVGKRRSR